MLPKINTNLIFIVVILGLFLIREGCHCTEMHRLEKKCAQQAGGRTDVIEMLPGGRIDTTFQTITDTVYSHPQTDTVILHRVDSFIQYETLPFDTIAALQQLYTEKRLHDSVPTQYGAVIITDTLFANSIQGRSVVTNFTVPVITKTEIQRIMQKKTAQVYAGIDVQGTGTDLLNGIGPSLLLKTKGDNIYRIGAVWNRQGFLQYGAGMAWKIKFK